MVTITNNTNDPLAFVIGREKSGEPRTETLKPGETRDIEVLGGRDAPIVQGREKAGVITVGAHRARSVTADTPAAKK